MMPTAEEPLRQKLMAAARQLGERAHYRSAGTVEFLVEQETASFYFLEVNTRLQVQGWLPLCAIDMARQPPVWAPELMRQWPAEQHMLRREYRISSRALLMPQSRCTKRAHEAMDYAGHWVRSIAEPAKGQDAAHSVLIPDVFLKLLTGGAWHH